MLKEHKDLLDYRIKDNKLLIGNGSEIKEKILESGVSSYKEECNYVKWVPKNKFKELKEKFGTKKNYVNERNTFNGIEAPSILGEEGGFVFSCNERAHFYFQAKLSESPFKILENSGVISQERFIELKKFFSGLEKKSTNPDYYYVARWGAA